MATLSAVVPGSQRRSISIASSASDLSAGQRVVGAIPTRGSWRRCVVVAVRAGASDSGEADNGRVCGFCSFYECCQIWIHRHLLFLPFSADSVI